MNPVIVIRTVLIKDLMKIPLIRKKTLLYDISLSIDRGH